LQFDLHRQRQRLSVTHRARGSDDRGAREAAIEPAQEALSVSAVIVGHLVETVEQENEPPDLALVFERALQAVCSLGGVAHRLLGGGQQVAPLADQPRQRGEDRGRRAGISGELAGKMAQEGGLTRAGIAEHHPAAGHPGVVGGVKDEKIGEPRWAAAETVESALAESRDIGQSTGGGDAAPAHLEIDENSVEELQLLLAVKVVDQPVVLLDDALAVDLEERPGLSGLGGGGPLLLEKLIDRDLCKPEARESPRARLRRTPE
jgi:hypothetical protein